MSSTRLAAIPPAFGVRTLPAQATEYTFAYIQVPEDVSVSLTLLQPPFPNFSFHKSRPRGSEEGGGEGGGGAPIPSLPGGSGGPFITEVKRGLVAPATGAAELRPGSEDGGGGAKGQPGAGSG